MCGRLGGRVSVGGDDVLVDPPGDLDGGVILVGEHRVESGFLLLGEQRCSGVQGAAGAIQRVAGAASVAEGFVLDAGVSDGLCKR